MAIEVFSDIPVRSNGQLIEASWFNTIRTLLVQILGDSSGEVSQDIGQTDTNQDLTELFEIDKADFSRVDFEYMVRRAMGTSGDDFFQSGTGVLHYKARTDEWTLNGINDDIKGDDALITFGIREDTGGGGNKATVTYSTTTISGTGAYTGTIKIRSKKWII